LKEDIRNKESKIGRCFLIIIVIVAALAAIPVAAQARTLKSFAKYSFSPMSGDEWIA